MIYLLMHEYADLDSATLVYDNQYYSIKDQANLPYEIAKARNHGEKVVMNSISYGRGWWNNQFIEKLPISDCISIERSMEYFDLPKLKGGDEAELVDIWRRLLPISEHIHDYWRMEEWLGYQLEPSDNSLLKAASIIVGSVIQAPPIAEMLYGYGIDTVNRTRLERPLSSYEFNRWKQSSVKLDDWRYKLEMACKIATDSIKPVTLEIAGGTLRLTISMVQTLPGAAALSVALPCGAALYYSTPRIKGAALLDSAGKPLSHTRLMRNVLRFMAMQLERSDRYATITRTRLSDYEKWIC